MSTPDEETSDATVRARHQTQMPRYLKDYEVDYVPEQRLVHTASDHSHKEEQLVGATGGPLAPCNTLVACNVYLPAYEGNPHISPEVLHVRLKDLEEENHQLRRELREHSAAHSPRPLSPSQLVLSPSHSMHNMEEQASTSMSYQSNVIKTSKAKSGPRREQTEGEETSRTSNDLPSLSANVLKDPHKHEE
ncbi:hypothetical protein Q8A67_013263 [Cirrhinus molitorella]|uniref:Uncharacterized protein n=1 Tax=Cirrhinus molitorella TaxID=172907 RepID=A0AA88TKF9_9TELE|nr:hypothetical protein Q8A67_013263 [Cirrhinus molitorella]